MGAMIDGRWTTDAALAETDPDGTWRRAESTIRHWVTRDGAAGPTGEGGFQAEAGRYHIYAAWNCPWAHRALLTRVLLGLEDAIDVSYALPRRTD
jgi:putative glutathione S-transferase